MNPFTFLYNDLLYRPLLNLLVWITQVLPGQNVGWAIIIVTIIVRLILLPPSIRQARTMQTNQDKMKDVQARLKEVREKHKKDQSKQAEETMRIYKEAGVNPASGCLPLLVQLPILLALYRVFLNGLDPNTIPLLYSFVTYPEALQSVFLGIDLAVPSLRLGVLAGIGQFFLMKLSSASAAVPTAGQDNDTAAMMASMQRNMMYIFPVMTIFIALQLPAALSLYWVASTGFGLIQQQITKRYLNISSAAPF